MVLVLPVNHAFWADALCIALEAIVKELLIRMLLAVLPTGFIVARWRHRRLGAHERIVVRTDPLGIYRSTNGPVVFALDPPRIIVLVWFLQIFLASSLILATRRTDCRSIMIFSSS